MTAQNRIRVGILGATGNVGQQFLNLLRNHPWFEVTWLGASERSAGKTYADAAHWNLDGTAPGYAAELPVHLCEPTDEAPQVVFSGLDASVAGTVETAFAESGRTVISNAKNYRMEDDVPLLVPEINPDHLALVERQRANRGWSGAIVTNPNCVAIPVSLGLAPLKPFGITKVMVTSYQAVSGAGYPGTPSLDIMGNVVPFIKGEEPKVAPEVCKILGGLDDGRVAPLHCVISPQCARVPTIDGHLVAVSVELEAQPSIDDLKAAYRAFRGVPQDRELPSAPTPPIVLTDATDRPQPRKDIMAGGGMAATVGRLRECPVLGYKFFILAHNTIRGAAGAAILNAELMHSEGMLQ